MKTIKKYIAEQENINESVLSIAGTIVAAIIGYKFLKALLKGGLMVWGLKSMSKSLEKLESIQSEMTKILEKYPESQKELSFQFQNVLKHKGGKRDSFTLSELTGIESYLTDFSDEDKKQFISLYNDAKQIQDKELGKFTDDDIDLLKDKKLIK